MLCVLRMQYSLACGYVALLGSLAALLSQSTAGRWLHSGKRESVVERSQLGYLTWPKSRLALPLESARPASAADWPSPLVVCRVSGARWPGDAPGFNGRAGSRPGDRVGSSRQYSHLQHTPSLQLFEVDTTGPSPCLVT